MPLIRLSRLCTFVTLMPLLALFGCKSGGRWYYDDRYTNAPFHEGRPLQAERAAKGYSGPGYQTRLRDLRDSRTFDRADMDRTAAGLLRQYRGKLGEYSGVRDERYFLISIRPDVMVVAPFVNKIPLKTAAEMEGLTHDVVDKVLNPLFAQIMQQHEAAERQGVGEGWIAELPGPNYAELGCAFPNLPGAQLWAPALGRARPFDDEARKLLAKRLGLEVRRHPSAADHWQLVGCPT